MSAFKTKLKSVSPLLWFAYIGSAVMFFVMLGLTIYRGVNGIKETNMVVMVLDTLLWLIPFLCKPIFKDKISDGIYFFFVIFAFLAAFLGSVIGLYHKTWWYDLAMHFSFGYVASVIGLFFLCKLTDVKAEKTLLVILVCFAVSLAFALIWEIMEFVGDNLFGNFSQGVPIQGADGNKYTPVNDTMEDVICNTCGAIVFAVHYAAHAVSGRSLFMGALKKDFTGNRKPSCSEKNTEEE